MSQYPKSDSKEISKILGLLEPEENVILLGKGSETVFLTNKRILIRKNSFLGRNKIKDISYQKIVNTQLKKGITSSKMVIYTDEDSATVGSLNYELALRLSKRINEILSQTKSNHDDNQEIKDLPEIKLDIDSDLDKSEHRLTSILNELERLSKLKNDGVLTEGEFQLIKKDILSKISR